MELFQIPEVTEESPKSRASPMKPIIKLTAAESNMSETKSEPL